MPSIYTHDYYAKDTYKKLEKENIYKIDNKLYYLIFAQSFDNLFYYNAFVPKPGKKIRKFGHYAHTHKVWLYFKNIVEYIKKNKLYDDINLGYLYGSLMHYTLDSTCHPYIHYISGRLNKKNIKETRKYIGNHAINEIAIDAEYYSKDHKDKYYKYKVYNLIPKTKFPEELITTMNYIFKETFNKDDIGHIYNTSYNQSHYIYKYLMYDRTSIKRMLYNFFDFITPFKLFKANVYSHHTRKLKYDVLNTNKEKWLHPVTGEEHNESFEELYNIAQKKVIKCIKKCNDFFNDKCTIEQLEKVIGNISYSSGLDAEIRPTFTYFKY